MTLNQTLEQLQALGSAKVRAQNAKSGAVWLTYPLSIK